MGIELKDFRGRITPETWCWLEALSRATGADQQAIVRDVLHRWATEQLHASSIAGKLLDAEGISRSVREGAGR